MPSKWLTAFRNAEPHFPLNPRANSADSANSRAASERDMAIGTNGTYWQNRVGSGAMNTKPSESLGFPLVHPPIGTIGTNGTGDSAKNDPSKAVPGAAGTRSPRPER